MSNYHKDNPELKRHASVCSQFNNWVVLATLSFVNNSSWRVPLLPPCAPCVSPASEVDSPLLGGGHPSITDHWVVLITMGTPQMTTTLPWTHSLGLDPQKKHINGQKTMPTFQGVIMAVTTLFRHFNIFKSGFYKNPSENQRNILTHVLHPNLCFLCVKFPWNILTEIVSKRSN